MPFANRVASIVFNSATIQRVAPAQSGVYGLSNARQWVYIAESDNIRESLLQHLSETDTVLSNHKPSGFTFELCDGSNRAARRERLVQELSPICNRPQTTSSRYGRR